MGEGSSCHNLLNSSLGGCSSLGYASISSAGGSMQVCRSVWCVICVAVGGGGLDVGGAVGVGVGVGVCEGSMQACVICVAVGVCVWVGVGRGVWVFVKTACRRV